MATELLLLDLSSMTLTALQLVHELESYPEPSQEPVQAQELVLA